MTDLIGAAWRHNEVVSENAPGFGDIFGLLGLAALTQVGQARRKVVLSLIVRVCRVTGAVLRRVRVRREVQEIALGQIGRLICATGAFLSG